MTIPTTVEGLVAEARGLAFRRVTDALGEDHEGLSKAARRARQKGILPNLWARKLIKLDEAFAVIRHLTSQRASRFDEDLAQELENKQEADKNQANITKPMATITPCTRPRSCCSCWWRQATTTTTTAANSREDPTNSA